MFENMTAERILGDALDMVPDRLDKREGAVIYDTLAPFCTELARVYADLELVLMQLFPQTASRDYLLMAAQQRGFEPKKAMPLEIKAHFDAAVPTGARFNMQEYNFRTEEALGNGMYRLVCETAGSAPNSVSGTLTPINYISGLTECVVVSILSPGTDEEDTEEFRQRFLESISHTQAFGGNIADYKAKLKAMDGVGQVKVFAADDWNGAGTVGIYITDEADSPVTAEFAARIQEAVDPGGNGTGTGIAPIGHRVSVLSAESAGVNISIRVTADGGSGGLENRVRAALAEYLAKRNKKWETRNVSVYASGIVAALMELEGVADAEATVNGGASHTFAPSELACAANAEVVIDD